MASSFKKLFGSKKRENNKENVPSLNRSTLDRSSVREVDLNSTRASDVYLGDFRAGGKSNEMHIPNPYSVMTAPKTTKGPRSCPGGPISDRRDQQRNDHYREFMNATERYESMRRGDDGMRRRQDGDDRRSERGGGGRRREYDMLQQYQQHSIDKSSEYGSADPSPVERRHKDRAHLTHSSFYEEGFPESDDEGTEHRMRMLETKLAKLQRRYHGDKRMWSEQIEAGKEETLYYKHAHDRVERSYQHAKRNLEAERQRTAELTKMLSNARRRIAELEESVNDNSLLMCSATAPFSTHKAQTGAGEALMPLEGELLSVAASTASLHHARDDDRDEDEVRVFRTAECESPAEVARGDGTASPAHTLLVLRSGEKDRLCERDDVERVVLSPDGDEMSQLAAAAQFETTLSAPSRSTRRSASDPELCVDDRRREREERRRQQLFAKAHYMNRECLADTSSGSDSDAMRIMSRQLRRHGSVVRFCPPRTAIHQGRPFRKYGKGERSALAEFDYLLEVPTDVSGLLSSPELNAGALHGTKHYA